MSQEGQRSNLGLRRGIGQVACTRSDPCVKCSGVYHYHHHHHHLSVMQLGHLLAHSGLTCPEASSEVCHDSFCQSDSSVSVPWVIYYEAFCLNVVSSLSCIPVICPKLELFFTPLQCVYLFCNLSKCILLYFSCTSSLLLIFF
jgi:hypothetical protein